MNLSPIKFINNIFNEICAVCVFCIALELFFFCSLSSSKFPVGLVVYRCTIGHGIISNDNACVLRAHAIIHLKLLSIQLSQAISWFNIMLNFNELTSSSIWLKGINSISFHLDHISGSDVWIESFIFGYRMRASTIFGQRSARLVWNNALFLANLMKPKILFVELNGGKGNRMDYFYAEHFDLLSVWLT